jgi:UDP-N-acetyl-D-mannosaminuronic acid dehydrogenase
MDPELKPNWHPGSDTNSDGTGVCVVGLGRIGLPTAAAFVEAGWDVFGVDRDTSVLESIKSGRLPYDEPDLQGEVLARLALHGSVEEVEADVWVVCVGTNRSGTIDASGVRAVTAEIVMQGAQTILIESTVPPGTCASLAAAHGVQFAHCPERAAPGSVLEDIATTSRLIGGVDEASTAAAHAIYSTISDAPLIRCTATEAELSKLAENASREVQIAFANELAEKARELGLDPFDVVELANSHPRVGILRPGLGVGGDCLPMATDYFASDDASSVAAAGRRLHDELPGRLAQRLLALEPRPTKVAVLGTTYKPDVRYDHDPFAEQPVGALLASLREAGLDVRAWDPSMDASLEDALRGVELVVFGCAHGAFADLEPADLKALVATPRLVDPVGAVDAARWRGAGWTT